MITVEKRVIHVRKSQKLLQNSDQNNQPSSTHPSIHPGTPASLRSTAGLPHACPGTVGGSVVPLTSLVTLTGSVSHDVQRCVKAPYGREQGRDCNAPKKKQKKKHQITLKRGAFLRWHAAWQRVAVYERRCAGVDLDRR